MGLFTAIAVAAAGTVVATVPGYAACHSFTVSVSPGTVTEGASLTATVSRDGTVNPSSVQVDTVDGTALAGRDYVAVHQRLSFTTDQSQGFQVATIHNPAHEGPQTFHIRLSGGMGCQVNPNFAYGAPAEVSVADIDRAPEPNPTQSHPVTPPPVVTARPSTPPAAPPSPAAAPSPTPVLEALAPSPTPSADASPTPSARAVLASSPSSSGGPGSALPGVVAIVVVLVLAGGGLYWYRRRSTA